MDAHPVLLLSAPGAGAGASASAGASTGTSASQPHRANGGFRTGRALPSPGARRLNHAMQMLSLHVGDLLGLPWWPALILQTFIQPYGIKDYS